MNDQYPPGTDVQNLVDLAMAEALGGEESSAGHHHPIAKSLAHQARLILVAQSVGCREHGSNYLVMWICRSRSNWAVRRCWSKMCLRLAEGSVVELDKLAGDPVDVYVNNRLVARGEVLVLNDNFCIRISEIVDQLDEKQIELAIEANDAD